MKPANKPPHRRRLRVSVALVIAAVVIAGGIPPSADAAERASVPDEDVVLRSLRRADVRERVLDPDHARRGVDDREISVLDLVHAGTVSTNPRLVFVMGQPLSDASFAWWGAVTPRALGARAPPPSGVF